jgi:hypothetical protein
MLVERCTQKVIGTYDEAVALEKKFDALEAKIGNVPPKRRYMVRYARYPANTFIWEREWESMAAIAAYQAKAGGDDPGWAEAYAEAAKVLADSTFELFELFDLP